MSDAMVVARRRDDGEVEYVPYREEPTGRGFVMHPLTFGLDGRARGFTFFVDAEAVVERYLACPLGRVRSSWDSSTGTWAPASAQIFNVRPVETGFDLVNPHHGI